MSLLLPHANKGWRAIFLAFFQSASSIFPLSEQRWALARNSCCFLGWIDWSDCRAQNIGIMRVGQSASSVENRAAASQGSGDKHFCKKAKNTYKQLRLCSYGINNPVYCVLNIMFRFRSLIHIRVWALA